MDPHIDRAAERVAADVGFLHLADASRIENHWLDAGSELGAARCLLRHYRRNDSAERTVLLVHGASANSRTFLVPGGGLVRHLLDQGLDVWTLDWRASSLLSRLLRSGSDEKPRRDSFTLELAAKHELAAALKIIEAESGRPISMLAHCVGGALAARALLDGTLGERVDRVVLTALGAFFRVGVENWLKGNERVLESVANGPSQTDGAGSAISPWVATGRTEFAWPRALEKMFDIWKTTPARHACDNAFCHRVSFMFGMPYNPNLIEAMHAVDSSCAPEDLESATPEHGFWGQFGAMPVSLYIQVAQCLRRGRLEGMEPERDAELRDRLSKVQLTLITGNENQLWHRESMDIFYDWLQRLPSGARKAVKHVESGFGHQDMFWCEESTRRRRMYERFLAALAPANHVAPLKERLLTSIGWTSSRAVPTH